MHLIWRPAVDREISAEVIARLQPLASRRYWQPCWRAVASMPRSYVNLSSLWSRRATKRRALIGDRRLSIPTIGWSPASWSDVGMSACSPSAPSRTIARLEKPETPLSEVDRERLLALGSDLERPALLP